MYEMNCTIFDFCYNADMTDRFCLAFAASKEYQITCFCIDKTDEFTMQSNFRGGVRYRGIELSEYKINKSTTVKTPRWSTAITIWFFDVFFSENNERIASGGIVVDAGMGIIKNGNFFVFH